VVTLAAVWGQAYTVVYNDSGGEGAMEPSEFAYGVPQALRPNTFTRTGYVFIGWDMSEAATVVYFNDEMIVSNLTNTPGGAVTLYAVWGQIYTVVYNANGGTGTMANSQLAYGEDQNLRENTFTRTGYTFTGWATSAAGTVVYTDGQKVNNLTTAGGTITLYAKWEIPAFTENFESGSGTSLAGWTFVNGTQTNKWYIGTATANGGTKSCYISNNSSANSYTLTSTSKVHFYRDFTNIKSISFDVKVQGEIIGNDVYDGLAVYLVETTVTPVAGTLLLPDPLEIFVMEGTSWRRQTITVPSTITGTKRLVFTWLNDSSDGTQPPAAIDNITIMTSQ
jgi:uncharacterized repeat protein (TIGR02543 family)